MNLYLLFAQGVTPVDAEAASPTTQIIVAVLASGGISAILAAIVTGLFSKRKLGAEATEIITKAAAGVVTSLQAEIDRQSAMVIRLTEEYTTKMAAKSAEITHMAQEHTSEMAEVRRVLQLHVAWDAIAIAKMNEFGIDLPPAPPLMPPRLGHSLLNSEHGHS